MSLYGSQQGLNTNRRVGSKSELTGGGTYHYPRSECGPGGGNGYDPYMDGYKTYTFSKSSIGGMGGGMGGGGMVSGTSGRMASVMMSGTMSGTMSGLGGGGAGGTSVYTLSDIRQKCVFLQNQCQEYLKKAEYALQSGNGSGDAERYMSLAKEAIEQLKSCALDLRQLGQPNDNVVRTLEIYKDQLKTVHMAYTGTLQRRRSTKGSSATWEELERSFNDAMGWIEQQKRLIVTAPWGEDPATIQQQLISHQRFHSSIQRSPEVDRAKEELRKKEDKLNLHALDQEWDSLQQMSFGRTQQLRDFQQIVEDITREIIWVNEKEEQELVFDWGDKNIKQYIPKKQESYSKLMSALEEKEKDLNKLKAKVDTLLNNKHPASVKIQAYLDTLQTQWSWLLQITKCIDIHLKENAAYDQFFREVDETFENLKKEHGTVRTKFKCDKNTSLEDLLELLKNLEKEKDRILENKRPIVHLCNKAKSIVRLKPRNPEEKSSSSVIVKALCDFKQDQKVICKGNEAILKDNSQRSKWQVTGPGGLDMWIPSVCLIVPPPNPIAISKAIKNEQYFDAILSICSQLFISIKSLIAWQYCLMDMKRINSLTISMLAQMRPEEYRQIIKNLEMHYEEFKQVSQSSLMFDDDDKRNIETQFNGAQAQYDQLVVQLPNYIAQQEQFELQQTAGVQHQQRVIIIQQQAVAEDEASRMEEERRRAEAKKVVERKTEVKKEVVNKEQQIKKETVRVTKTEPGKKRMSSSSSVHSASSSSSRTLSELHTLRLKLEAAEGSLSQHVHICLGDDGVHDCVLRITQLGTVQHDINLIREQYVRLREQILKELVGMDDSDKAEFLRSELGFINQRLDSLDSTLSAYLQRLQALKEFLESVARVEDIVKLHEARLTEKETTSLSPTEVEDYMLFLKKTKAELDQKRDVLVSMEEHLATASHWNSQVGGPFHRCDEMLSKYTEQVGTLSGRWRRIQGQIDTRLQDLHLYLPQLQHYKQTSTSIFGWIDATRNKQDALQATKIQSIQALKDHISNQKTLNTEIKLKRDTVDSVLQDSETCVNSVKDYETDVCTYTSGLETLLNIPINRTMLRSPTIDLNHEATQLQTRYMELLTLSDDYYKFLGELLKNMEELKIRNTRIDLLEEELRLLKGDIEERNAKNKSLEGAVARYQLELSQSQSQLLSMEDVKRKAAQQCSASKESLDSTHGQLADLKDEVTRLHYMLEEEKSKRRLAEERYTEHQEECESVLKKRLNELETVSRSKMEVDKSVASKDHEIENLRRQLADETARVKELQKEISKVRTQCSEEITNLKLSYESQMHISRTDIQRLAAQREEDIAELQLQYERMEADRRNLEEELRRLRMSVCQTEEQRKRAEEAAHSQQAIITEEERRRRELECQVEVLIRQKDQENTKYREELAEAMKILQEKAEQLTYLSHSLEEETRRRKTTEEGQAVLEQTVAQLRVKLTNSSMAATQLRGCEEELQKIHLEVERESTERSRIEQNMTRLQGRIKDLQTVRDGLESQVESLRKANQEEVVRRRQVETELERTTMTLTEYTSTITALRQNQEQASTSEKRGEEERLKLQEELESILRQNKASAECIAQLSAELKALQQQLLQEHAHVKEANLRNEGLYRTLEEKTKTLNETSAELEGLKQMSHTHTKDRLRLEEELRVARQEKEEVLKSKKGSDDELLSQITALELQLQATERSNVDYRNLVSELSSEREKLKLETEKIQKQTIETTAMMQSIQSQYKDVVMERDDLLLKLKLSEKDKHRLQALEEELIYIKMSLDSELRNKQGLQEDNDRLKKDLSYWKDQNDSKQNLIRQYDTDKDHMEREKNSLQSEIDRLMRELRELEETYKSKLSAIQKERLEMTTLKQTMETELLKAREPPTLDATSLIFEGVRKPVTASELLECGVLDKTTFNQLVKGHKTIPEVSVDKKVSLKGTGPIAGVVIEGPKGPGSISFPLCKLTFAEAKKENLLPSDSIDLLLDAQAATGHIIDPRTNQKLTVDEACNQGVVDEEDRERLLAAEAAAVGYSGPGTNKPLSVFKAMRKGLIDKNTTLRLLQAQESVGGILDPILSVFLPKDTAIARGLLDDDICRALNQRPELYLDPDSEEGVTYMMMKRRCKVEPHTGLLLLPVPAKGDPSKLIFDGVRKPVTAKHLLDCGVLDRPTFKDLEKGKKTLPEVSIDKNINLKGTGPIAGVIAGCQGKMSFSEAKKQNLLSDDAADLLLEAQAATGHVIDPRNNQKLIVEEACTRGVVDIKDRDKLLTAEAAAVGYKDPSTAKPLSVFEAIKKGIIDRKTGLGLLQAQESVGGILDPNLSVFLPKDTAIKRNLLDEDLRNTLNQNPTCYLDPDTDQNVSYGTLKKRCKVEPHTGLLLLPINERQDPSKLIFDGVRKPVTAQQLLDCDVLDKPTFNKLIKGEKTVPEVSVEKKVFLKGTGSIAGVAGGLLGKMSLTEAKKKMVMPTDSADLLLDAQAATGHIIDPTNNQKLTVDEACARGVVDNRDRDRLLAAEAAAVGYLDPSTAKPLSVFEAMKKGIIDRKTGLRLLQAQDSVGGILDPNLSVFLPKDTAIKRNLLDEDLYCALNRSPGCYLDPDTEHDASYGALKQRCKTEPYTGMILLPITERQDPSKLVFDGVRKPISAQQLLECGVLDELTCNQLAKGQKTVPEVSVDKKVFLKGTGSIAGVAAGPLGKMSFTEAKKLKIMSSDSADMLLFAQAATGHIIDPKTNQKLTVKEACARKVVNREDESNLYAAEAAVIGYKEPNTAKILSAGQAVKRGLIDNDTALRILQAQESVGGILDPVLSIFLPKDIAKNRDLIDEDLYRALNQCPECYLDPDTQQSISYISLKTKCKADPSTGLLLLPEPKKPLTVQGLRGQVSIIDLVDSKLLKQSDMDQLNKGRLTGQDIEDRLGLYLKGSTCIAGVYDEDSDKVMPLYQAMKDGLLQPRTTLELLEAQAASGFIVDPANNLFLTVSDAYSKRLFGPELKDKLLAAERAVTGYKLPGTEKVISLFQAIEQGLVEKSHGIHLLEAQMASGGIIDPERSHRIDVYVAYKRGYLNEEMNRILTNQGDDTKGFFDPNTEENLTYLELKKRCITDKKTGLILLPVMSKKKQESTLKNTKRQTRVIIVDPETNKEMRVREAYDKGYIDYNTFLELSQQECEWEEITITAPDGSQRFVIVDRKTGTQYDITELLEKGAIHQSVLDQYRSQTITLTEFADIISNKAKPKSSSSTTSRPLAVSATSSVTASSSRTSAASLGTLVETSSMLQKSEASSLSSSSSSVMSRPLSPTLAKMTTTRTTTFTERSASVSSVTQDSPDSLKHISSVSFTVASPVETVTEQGPIGAIFDTDSVEMISITEALNRGLVDSITAHRLLEAQACTGGIVNPTNGTRLSIQEASRLGIINDDMATKLKPAQKAYFGFEDVKTRKKMSAAQAMKEMWLPYEAGQRFLEYQFVTGGLYDPEMDCRRTMEDALKMGWLDGRAARKLQDPKSHAKNLTCPKSKLKISYKEALDNCLLEKGTGVKMLQASSMSSRGISSPYNASSAPGSTTGSRSGSRQGSRRGSLDLGSPSSSLTNRYSHTSFSTFSSTR
ncbi:desmoplakin-B-like isoform X1 [Channa argus]|uniref:desmoplakin-B-like isoform X1 n=1 Tax=Channa argus TaxID=215402 RepID=UPI003521C72B